MQRPGKRTHSVEPCEICGGVGGAKYQKWMVTCTRCHTARVHVYCNFPEVSREWVCESCWPRDVVSLEDGAKEDMLRTMPQDSSTRASHENIHELGPSFVQHTCSERELKPVKSGKVKYISLEEVIKLSSVASEKEPSPRSHSGPKPGLPFSMKALWNSLAGSRSAAASKSSPSDDLVKPPRHAGDVRSMVNQQVPQTSKN